MSASPPIPVVVRSARPIALEVREVTLAAADGAPLPAFTPGAHIDVHLAPGLVRPYSLCGPAGDLRAYTIAVKREPDSRGGSRAVHEQLAVDVRLAISAPRNDFPLGLDAPHTVLVAGGIGITPLVCMARALQAAGRPFRLHYFCRSPGHAAYLDLLQGDAFAAATDLHFGLGREATAAALQRALAAPPAGAQVYLCGPRGFMDLVRDVAAQQHWPAASVHLEYFGAGAQAAPAAGDTELQVTLARSGRTVLVPPAVPIIDVLRACGIAVETSCEQGVCGTCVTRVLDGIPEHRDLFLTAEEQARGDCMALCVSRAAGRHLVLDL